MKIWVAHITVHDGGEFPILVSACAGKDEMSIERQREIIEAQIKKEITIWNGEMPEECWLKLNDFNYEVCEEIEVIE